MRSRDRRTMNIWIQHQKQMSSMARNVVIVHLIILCTIAQTVDAGEAVSESGIHLGCCERADKLAADLISLRRSSISTQQQMEESTSDLTTRLTELTAKLIECSTLRSKAESELALLRLSLDTDSPGTAPPSDRIHHDDDRVVTKESGFDSGLAAMESHDTLATFGRANTNAAVSVGEESRDASPETAQKDSDSESKQNSEVSSNPTRQTFRTSKHERRPDFDRDASARHVEQSQMCSDLMQKTESLKSVPGGRPCAIGFRHQDPNPTVTSLLVYQVLEDGSEVFHRELYKGDMVGIDTTHGTAWRVYESAPASLDTSESESAKSQTHGRSNSESKRQVGGLRGEFVPRPPFDHENPFLAIIGSCHAWPLVSHPDWDPQSRSIISSGDTDVTECVDVAFAVSDVCNANHPALSKCDPMRYLSEIEPAPGLHIVCPLHLQPDEQVSYRCNPRMRLVIFKDAFYSNDGQCSTSLLVPKSKKTTGEIVQFVAWGLHVLTRGSPGGGEFMPRMFTPGGKAFPYGDRAFDDTLAGPDMANVRRGVGSPLLHRRSLFFIEGGNFVYPGVKIGHIWNVGPMLGIKDRPVGMKTLSLRPLVFEVKEFLTRAERVAIMEVAEPHLSRATIVDHTETHRDKEFGNPDRDGDQTTVRKTSIVSPTRTNTRSNLMEKDVTPTIRRTEEKLMQLSRLPLLQSERMQVLRYEPGQQYDVHRDYFDWKQYIDRPQFLQHQLDFGGNNRFLNLYLYLNGDPDHAAETGGNTSFPIAGRKTFSGNRWTDPETGELTSDAKAACEGYKGRLAIPAEAGKLILTYSLLPNTVGDYNSIHGSCPVVSGTKWGANMWQWIRARPLDRDSIIYEQPSTAMMKREPLANVPGGHLQTLTDAELQEGLGEKR